MSTTAALICARLDTDFIEAALVGYLGSSAQRCLVVSAPSGPLTEVLPSGRLADPELLDSVDDDPSQTVEALADALRVRPRPQALVVDMAWTLGRLWGARDIEAWGSVAERLAADLGVTVVSVYDQDTLVEDDLAAALRTHEAFIAPTGHYANPLFLPRELVEAAATGAQLRHILHRLVPDYADTWPLDGPVPGAARGISPQWVPPPSHPIVASRPEARWRIQCLGSLEVFVGDGEPVEWRRPGSSPVKSKLLFAYLLTRGGRPAPAEQISEVLWPDIRSERDKRNRLHHTISNVRKSLGSRDAISRSGDQYRLDVPASSWIDVERFEQLVRRSVALYRSGDIEGTLWAYTAADRLYRGQLFGDLPLEYLYNEMEDWCMSRRTWLNSVAVKMYHETSSLLRSLGRLLDAQECCQRAIEIEPTHEQANLEMVKVLIEQGRADAARRLYRQFEAVSAEGGVTIEGSAFDLEFQRLIESRSRRRRRPHAG